MVIVIHKSGGSHLNCHRLFDRDELIFFLHQIELGLDQYVYLDNDYHRINVDTSGAEAALDSIDMHRKM